MPNRLIEYSIATRALAAMMCGLLAAGCGGTTGGGSGTKTSSSRIAGGESLPPRETEPPAPPYRFEPSSHEPIYRNTEAPVPDLSSFPALEMHFARCFGYEEKKPIPIATPSTTQPKKNKNQGSSPSSSGKRGKSKSKDHTADKPKASSGGAVSSGSAEAVAPIATPSESAKPPKEPSRSAKADFAQPPPPMEQQPAMSAPSSGAENGASADEAYAAEPVMETAPSREKYTSDNDNRLSRKERREHRRERHERRKAERKAAKQQEAAEEASAEDAAVEGAAPQRIAGKENARPLPIPEPMPDPDMGYEDWGQATYLSNDDSMSLSSAQRIIYAIDHFQPLPSEHIRPHELLNYFSFATKDVMDGYDFSVDGDLKADPKENGIYTLGLAVRGRPVDKAGRRNTVLTLVIDRSGSMSDEGRMDYLKRGLMRMVDELKTGDMVHIVLFDHELCVPMQNFVVGRDDQDKLEKVIFALQPRGSTDLHSGLSTGYEIADRTYRDDSSNRVVLITDALTNTGETDERMISMISKYYESRRIRLSGVGVGREFNDSLLDKLTEQGKGAYVFLGSEAEVDAVFGNRFISLIETTALDVHFRLYLPPSLRMNVFYGEESSTVKEDVQEIHYFANTSQLFLSDLMARGRTLRPEDDVMLSIEYKDPETEAALTEEYAFNLGTMLNSGTNASKGRFIMAWVDMLAEMAARPDQSYEVYAEGSWQDEEGWNRCEQGRQILADMSRDISSDPEVTRVLQLFDKYCARYERPRHPVRRTIAAPESNWPGAVRP